MHRVSLLIPALMIASAATAQPTESGAQRREVAASVLGGVADCTVRQEPAAAARWVAEYQPPATPDSRTLKRVFERCLTGAPRGSMFSSQTFVMRGVLGLAFVRNLDRLPASVALPALPQTPANDFDIVLAVAACVVERNPDGARRFAEAVPGLAEEQAAFGAIDAQAAQCIAPWPTLSIDGTLLRAGLGIALFRTAAGAH